MADVINVTGIILSSMPVGESDRRIVILTKELGKISAFAKGARRVNSPLIGLTRPFIFGTFEVYRGRDSYSVYKINAKEYFEELVNDFDAVCYGYYFAEIADYYSKENLDGKDIINLLYVTLKALIRKKIPSVLIRYIYELKMIAINGECPDFFTCRKCKKETNLEYFSLSHNGLYCSDCMQEARDKIYLNKDAVYTLQYIVTSPLNKLYSFTLNNETFIYLKQVVNRLESQCFDKNFKSKEMLFEENTLNN
jgi:DNA repair protein RecO (recombination protein O)